MYVCVARRSPWQHTSTAGLPKSPEASEQSVQPNEADGRRAAGEGRDRRREGTGGGGDRKSEGTGGGRDRRREGTGGGGDRKSEGIGGGGNRGRGQ